MTAKNSKCLVIDASVARSAGEKNATYPNSVYCRDFLETVLNICHQVVMTPEIKEEWDKHQSKFTNRWIRTMIAKKKFITYSTDSIEHVLLSKIEKCLENDRDKVAMFKDFHLIEAARKSDKIIISLDEIVRKLFSQSAKTINELQEITWVNPIKQEEDSINWLKNGAKFENHRCLKNYDK